MQQNKKEKRFYSPKFSEIDVVSVRRLAWALDKPMTDALNLMVQRLPSIIDSSKVCLSCKDRSRCKVCVFVQHSSNPAALAELAFQN